VGGAGSVIVMAVTSNEDPKCHLFAATFLVDV
jgi:hypothetical protein